MKLNTLNIKIKTKKKNDSEEGLDLQREKPQAEVIKVKNQDPA
tara:strand:- start:234 stop:362 length:129 start_codon:yes stop_codon:yes gene_type:complete